MPDTLALILLFYNLAIQNINDAIGGSAANGALIRLKTETLMIRTGYAAEKSLDGSLDDGQLVLTIDE